MRRPNENDYRKSMMLRFDYEFSRLKWSIEAQRDFLQAYYGVSVPESLPTENLMDCLLKLAGRTHIKR